jgi:2'-5' RNA ligase
MRCFVAIDLSPAVRAALGDAQATLRAACARADVRWAAPTQFHLTLKFLGQVADERVPEVAAALAPVAGATAPIVLAAAGLGGFPSPSRPRVLWTGVRAGVAELGVLAAAIDRALAPLGFPLEGRPFRGHVTIGRVRSPKGLGRLAAALRRAAEVQLGSWTAREVVLYQSKLRPTGAVYEAVARLSMAENM